MAKIISLKLRRLLRLLRLCRPLRLLKLLRLLRLLRVGQMVAIPRRPLEEEAEVGSRNKEIEEKKGGPGPDYGNIYRKAQQPSRSIRGRYTAPAG